MNINQFVSELKSSSGKNETLELLAGILVEKDARLAEVLAETIRKPEEIHNTHSFASVLEFLANPDFIPPLIEAVSKAEPGRTPWLADYLYALGSVLMDLEDFWSPEEGFVHLLGTWLGSPGGGEIAWKSAVVLSQLDHPANHEYLFSGATDRKLFHQGRAACLSGIVNFYPQEAPALLEQLARDPEKEVREEAARARRWLDDED